MRKLSHKILLRRIEGTKGLNNFTNTEASMLAMALDSDGCISAEESTNRDYYSPVFVFGGSSILPLELARRYGETVYNKTPKGSNSEIHPYTWQISKQKSLKKFLLQIRPYVILKWKQVDIALKMLEVLEIKSEGWKKKLVKLGSDMGYANKAYKNPDIDIDEYMEVGYLEHIRIMPC